MFVKVFKECYEIREKIIFIIGVFIVEVVFGLGFLGLIGFY